MSLMGSKVVSVEQREPDSDPTETLGTNRESYMEDSLYKGIKEYRGVRPTVSDKRVKGQKSYLS